MFIDLVLAATLSLVTPTGTEPTPAQDALSDALSVLEASGDGQALANYTLCYVAEKARNHPYYQVLGPTEAFPDSVALIEDLDARLQRHGAIDERDIEAAVMAEIEQRGLGPACKYTLIPNPESLRIMADRAAYRRDALAGHVDPQEDYRAFVDAKIRSTRCRTSLTAIFCCGSTPVWPTPTPMSDRLWTCRR